MLVANDYVFSQALFLQCISICYLIAFASLAFQVKGLFGSKGILPIQEMLGNIRAKKGGPQYLDFPTLFWLNSSDTALIGGCIAGCTTALLCLLGFYPPLCLLLLWLGYLSFMSASTAFLSFQWDCLLLEVGFIAFFYSLTTPPVWTLQLALWVLLFRFMFSSGIVKVIRGCPYWNNLTALDYHYETQPLPGPLAWYAHQLPKWAQKGSVVATFLIEIVVPFFIFAPEAIRIWVVGAFILLQALISLTGNYTYFNFLTVALCLTLLSDQTLAGTAELPAPSLILQVVLTGIGLCIIGLNLIHLGALFGKLTRFHKIFHWLSPFYIVNGYGLFAHMTVVRDEIIVEGSHDGEAWQPYEFYWKPQDLHTRPKQVAPYQPRLDWQMWFAALSSPHRQTWFKHFLVRLLLGSEDVLRLLKTNPFPDKPPTWIRATKYQYHFADPKTKARTGQWWTRSFKGPYMPPISLK